MSVDDNVLLGLVQMIESLFDSKPPEDNLYYMYGKVFGDEIFLATFLVLSASEAINAATAFGIAAVVLVDALSATLISAVCAEAAVHTDGVLNEDS